MSCVRWSWRWELPHSCVVLLRSVAFGMSVPPRLVSSLWAVVIPDLTWLRPIVNRAAITATAAGTASTMDSNEPTWAPPTPNGGVQWVNSCEHVPVQIQHTWEPRTRPRSTSLVSPR